jgi:hypothetical protein
MMSSDLTSYDMPVPVLVLGQFALCRPVFVSANDCLVVYSGGMYTCVLSNTCKGSCSYTRSANTMSSALEVLGMSLPYSSSTPALYPGSDFSRLVNPFILS